MTDISVTYSHMSYQYIVRIFNRIYYYPVEDVDKVCGRDKRFAYAHVVNEALTEYYVNEGNK